MAFAMSMGMEYMNSLGMSLFEDVHQMRVATRRLRASLQVVEGVYDPKLIRRYRRGLRQIAESLGAVRDGVESIIIRSCLPPGKRQTNQPRQYGRLALAVN